MHHFHGFEKVDKESKEVFSHLVSLRKKLELDLQEDDLIDLLAVQNEELPNKDLMELEAQRKDEASQEEEEITEELKRFMMQEMSRGSSLCEEAMSVFETDDLNVACSNPVLPCHMMRKKDLLHRRHWIIFLKGK